MGGAYILYPHPLNPQGFQGMWGMGTRGVEVSEPLVQVWDWVRFPLKMGEGLEVQLVAQMLLSLPSLHHEATRMRRAGPRKPVGNHGCWERWVASEPPRRQWWPCYLPLLPPPASGREEGAPDPGLWPLCDLHLAICIWNKDALI